jgi:flagellar hook-basal body complex protein FliE
MPQVWDQQPNESGKRWDAFCHYKMQGSRRTLQATRDYLATVHGTTVQLSNVASEHDWRSRVRAWDAHLQQIADGEREDAIRDAVHRHTQSAQDVQDKARQAIAALDIGGAVTRGAVDALWKAARALKVGVEMERVSLGIPATTRAAEQDASASDVVDLFSWVHGGGYDVQQLYIEVDGGPDHLASIPKPGAPKDYRSNGS